MARYRLDCDDMRLMGRWMALVFIGLMAGCELETYRTHEGIGVMGPNGGYFQCFDSGRCDGTTDN